MVDSSGRRLGRLFAVGALLVLCGAALGVTAGSVGVGGARAAGPTLTIAYITPTSLQLKLGDGTIVRSGGVVPAGSYMVLVYDDGEDLNPNLTITGPGVALTSDLNSTGMGIDAPSTLGPFTFQTSSSYRIQDTNLGASSLLTFTTTATVSASSGSTSTGSSITTGSSQTSGGGTSTAASSTSSPASTPVRMLGTLRGSVSASGKATLSFGGASIKRLKAGLYRIVTRDHSKSAGLIVRQGSKRAITLSGIAAVGTSNRTMTLSAGKWLFEPTAHGPKTSFSVGK